MLLGRFGKMDLKNYYKGKKVFITGHTGFKGSWMCKVLEYLQAEVIGYSLDSNDDNLYGMLSLKNTHTYINDIRNYTALKEAIIESKPEIVFHMAAQPIVRESYKNPLLTYDTNVMGTVNLLESIRECPQICSFINVTTDKVYKNNEWCWGYRENEELNGLDPYSNSKSCSDLVTQCYRNCFLQNLPISICRAGNVIGGGDFSIDRIIPDCFRSASCHETIILRNPNSIRPYQHVLEPVLAYLYIAMKQADDPALQGEYNIGPHESDCVTTGKIASMFCEAWGDVNWTYKKENNAVHEANYLKLDCSKMKNILNWQPCWNIQTAIKKTVDWYKNYQMGNDVNDIMEQQIIAYLSLMEV